MRPVVPMLVLVFGALLAAPAPSRATATPDSVGVWETPFQVPVIGTHAILLPTGKVLFWYYPDALPGSESGVYDPVTQGFTYEPLSRNLFCAGYSYLPDGRLLVVGGDRQPQLICPDTGEGTADTHIYDPFTNVWTRLPDMHTARWYPTSIELGDGRALIAAGLDDSCGHVSMLERWGPENGHEVIPEGDRLFSLYPRLHLLSNGLVFHAGPDYGSYLWNPATLAWSSVGAHRAGSRFEAPTVLLPGFTDVAAIFGGNISTGGTRTCEKIDLQVPSPAWQYIAPMNYARFHNNAVLMPDGQVMVVGGGLTENYEDPVLIPEMYDPATNAWFDLPAHTYGRMYHSTALLLPDGRVLLGGQDDGPSAIYAEIYQPPYLFRGSRPIITAAPSEIGYGATFTVETPQADSIDTVLLMGLSTVTHSFNNTQRNVPLSFSHASGTQLTVTAPANGNVAPPTYYMLFLLHSRKVPSVAHMIRIGPPIAAVLDLPAPPAPRTFTVRTTPNPTAEHAVFQYSLPAAADVRMVLLDLGGREIRELERGGRTAGPHSVFWDGRDRFGARVKSGRYWCVVRAGEREEHGSVIVVR